MIVGNHFLPMLRAEDPNTSTQKASKRVIRLKSAPVCLYVGSATLQEASGLRGTGLI